MKANWKRIGILLLCALGGGIAAGAKEASPAVHCEVALDRSVLPSGSVQTAVVKVSLDAVPPPAAAERPPVNLSLVLDRSGSMSGSKIEKAKEAAIEALRRLDQRDLFSLVIYDHEVETLVPAQSAGYVEWIEGRIHGIRARGNTALFGGVSQGAAEARKNLHGPHVHRIILLSDGLANVGPSSPADLARLGAALQKEGISVTTIGVGTDFNEDLMTQLAQTSDGNHYFVESGADLPRIFAQELGDVLSVVARKVVIEIDCPRGVRPIRIIGRDGTIRDNQVRLHMNQLYGGQQKFALIEIEVPAMEEQTTLDIAVARCTYESTLSQEMEVASGRAVARFSNRKSEVLDSVDRSVQRAVFENEIAVARDEALDLYNAGKPSEAGEMLRRKQSELVEKNADFGMPDDMAVQAQQLDEDASQFEQESIGSTEKKSIRAGSYRVRTQQQN